MKLIVLGIAAVIVLGGCKKMESPATKEVVQQESVQEESPRRWDNELVGMLTAFPQANMACLDYSESNGKGEWHVLLRFQVGSATAPQPYSSGWNRMEQFKFIRYSNGKVGMVPSATEFASISDVDTTGLACLAK